MRILRERGSDDWRVVTTRHTCRVYFIQWYCFSLAFSFLGLMEISPALFIGYDSLRRFFDSLGEMRSGIVTGPLFMWCYGESQLCQRVSFVGLFRTER